MCFSFQNFTVSLVGEPSVANAEIQDVVKLIYVPPSCPHRRLVQMGQYVRLDNPRIIMHSLMTRGQGTFTFFFCCLSYHKTVFSGFTLASEERTVTILSFHFTARIPSIEQHPYFPHGTGFFPIIDRCQWWIPNPVCSCSAFVSAAVTLFI